jgi:hypothetical protein
LDFKGPTQEGAAEHGGALEAGTPGPKVNTTD